MTRSDGLIGVGFAARTKISSTFSALTDMYASRRSGCNLALLHRQLLVGRLAPLRRLLFCETVRADSAGHRGAGGSAVIFPWEATSRGARCLYQMNGSAAE